MTKDDDKLKPPPGLVEGLKRLSQFAPLPEKLALPPHLQQLVQQLQRGGPPLPRSVFQDVLSWLVAHERDGDPQVARQVRAWLGEQRLDPLSAAELHRLRGAAPAPKPKRQTKQNTVLCAILRALFQPDGRVPAHIGKRELQRKIKPQLWRETWLRLIKPSPPGVPGRDTIDAARRYLLKPPVAD